jgi:RimJ/RimL family protein N-acetyltransferase
MAVRIEPWGAGDISLLHKTMGDPAMTEHLGGPETPEKIAARHERLQRLADSCQGRWFKIVDTATGEDAGSVGYWERTWHDEQVYEIGWSVLPAFQGRGIAGAGTALAIAMAKADGKHRYMHAFPSVDNAPSNGVCRKLGFTLLGAEDFEYPKGTFMPSNDWRLDLSDRLQE